MAIIKSKCFLTALWENLKLIYVHGTLYTSCQTEDQLLITLWISRCLSKISFGFTFCLQILTDPWIGRSGRGTPRAPSEGISPSPWFKRTSLQLLKTELQFCSTARSLWKENLVVWWVLLGNPVGAYPKTAVHKTQSALGLWFTSTFLMPHNCHCRCVGCMLQK